MYIVPDKTQVFQAIKSNIELIASDSKSFDEYIQKIAIFAKLIRLNVSESEFINLCFKSWDYLKNDKNKSSNSSKK
ncbi:hypothetical protein A6769_37270 [Nostoc punctiforme NIES-2108]|uniref:Uncharacterized protein n=1 Tax=Nostoc punctiforme NIES-2108 TaxID=1356359 RepID=A0A367S102_NOSPU|nr:hypothetical protein A6769_37270 [Nostoc punctiforme NIES-2108]